MKEQNIDTEFLEKLTKLSRKLQTVFNQQVTAVGLTYPRARSLFVLAKRGQLTQSELAFELQLEQATVVRLVDRMEEIGLVERKPDPTDRRIKLLTLTPHGEEQAGMVRKVASDMRAQVFNGIDITDLKKGELLLDEIADRLETISDLKLHQK